jgi:hypothetical protein
VRSAYVIVIGYGAPASTLNSQRSGAGRGWGSLRDGGGGGNGGSGGGLGGEGGGGGELMVGAVVGATVGASVAPHSGAEVVSSSARSTALALLNLHAMLRPHAARYVLMGWGVRRAPAAPASPSQLVNTSYMNVDVMVQTPRVCVILWVDWSVSRNVVVSNTPAEAGEMGQPRASVQYKRDETSDRDPYRTRCARTLTWIRGAVWCHPHLARGAP